MDSLHGETAARRQAITELLFFASIGDEIRCRKIAEKWNLQPAEEKCCDYDKRTPLHLAAAEGGHAVVKWLVNECNVGINPIDRFQRTPLEEAVRNDHGEVVKLLEKHGGKVLNKDGELVDLAESRLSHNVRIFGDFDPEWEVDPSTLKIVEKLGEGEFGVVHKAMWHGTEVAVKVLKHNDQVALGDFRTELNVLQKVHHPRTVQFLGAVTKRTPYMIITEFMAGGSLADFLKGAPYLSLRRSVEIALDMAKGMNYLHNRAPQAVIHRDLKPANLLLGGFPIYNDGQRKQLLRKYGVVKIADFGLSKSLKLRKPNSLHTMAKSPGTPKQEDSYKMTGETGSYRYMAPEVFRHEPYNTKVDVYSFAMICFQLFEGVPPFFAQYQNPVDAARAAAVEGQRPIWGKHNFHGAIVPDTLKKLVEDCWGSDYDARPEFNDIIDRLREIYKTLPVEAGGDHVCCTLQ